MSPADTLARLLCAYQRRLVLHAALIGALGLACLAAVLWRLRELDTQLWIISAFAAAGLAGLGALVWGVRRRRVEGAGQLDRALGLESKLLTAAEFASAAHPPRLYPLLLQDAALAPASLSRHMPRVLDRWAWVLAAILLVVSWPWKDGIPPPGRPSGIPPILPPPMQTPRAPEPPSQPDASKETDQSSAPQQQSGGGQQQSDAGQQQGGGGSGSSSSGSGQQASQQPQPSDSQAGGGSGQPGSQQPKPAGESPHGQGGSPQTQSGQPGRGEDESQDAGSGQGNAPSSPQAPQSGGGPQPGKPSQRPEPGKMGQAPQPGTGQPQDSQPQPSAQQERSGKQSQSGTPDSSQAQTGKQPGGQQHADEQSSREQTGQGRQPQPSGQGDRQQPSEQPDRRGSSPASGGKPEQGRGQQADAAKPRPGEAEQGRGQQQSSGRDEKSGSAQASAAAAPSGQPGSAGSSAQQDALKGEIRQLLKEMSGQLQELQAQLQKEMPTPGAGTGTDPNLYEAPDMPEAGGERNVPIQLKTDEAPTAKSRPGGGSGKASKDLGDALPQQLPEDVSLSSQASQEQAVQRHPIPPEYRPVFERLSEPGR